MLVVDFVGGEAGGLSELVVLRSGEAIWLRLGVGPVPCRTDLFTGDGGMPRVVGL